MRDSQRASEQITAEVTSWSGVEAGPGRRGEFAFKVDGREIGHLHGDHAAHFSFPKEVWSEFPEFGILSPLAIGGSATALQIDTDDADALWTRAVEAGAQVHHELADQFWGERHGQLVDPFGHRWNIARHLRNVPDEEVAAA